MQRNFLKQLRRELPAWVERGWIVPGSEQAILDYTASKRHSEGFLSYALAILGVLLLGSGIITFFAANWDEMSKLAKLIVLFGSLWLSYGVADQLLQRESYPKTGQALLLLGVILFGANIMLIAQIYHIDSHYPNGVMLWALGGLLTAFLLPSHAAIIAALALATLWTGMEALDFDHIHWWFLPFLAIALLRIERQQWRLALHAALVGLLLWSLFSFFAVIDYRSEITVLYLIELFLLCYLALFITGMIMQSTTRLASMGGLVKRYSLFAALVSCYILTFPYLHRARHWDYYSEDIRTSADPLWIGLILLALTVVVGLALWHRKRITASRRPTYLLWGQGLIAVIVALLLATLFIDGQYGGIVAIGFNLLFFAGLVWLIMAGRYEHEPFLINMAFLFFALTLLSRYFDTFWSLMNRSFFFMAGGLILLVGGYFLERGRRKITGNIRTEEGQT